MLNRLLPRQVDNTYRGYKLALWLFALVVLVKVAMSVNSIFNGHTVASSADGIPLDTFTASRRSGFNGESNVYFAANFASSGDTSWWLSP